MSERFRSRPLRAAACCLALLPLTGCGGDGDAGDAERISLEALRAYERGDAAALCSRLSRAERDAAEAAKGSCAASYEELFDNRSGLDAVDRATESPLRPGPVRDVRKGGDKVTVTVAPPVTRFSAAQRRELVERYGPSAEKGLEARTVRVRVTREEGRLVVSF